MSGSSRRAPRMEAILAAGLTLLGGSLVGLRALSGGGGPPAAGEGVMWGNQAGLACLKPVVETAAAHDSPASPATVESVVRRVESIRGHRFDRPPDPLFLSPQALAGRAAGEVEYPPEEADVDAAILVALGALDPGTDLRGLVSQAVGEGVAGYYEPETGELVVGGTEEDGLDPIEEVILAHELTHALADQSLGLPSLEVPGPGEEDAAAASRAMVEGDASLAEAAYSAAGGILAAVSSIPALVASSAMIELPYHLRRGFLFPYAEGMGFVCRLHQRGGWKAVDAAYARPPSTTAQILFPERYRAGEESVTPRPVLRPPERLRRYTGNVATWTRVAVRSWGAADLLFLFEAPGDDPGRALDDPLARASAWGGGEIRLWEKEGRIAASLALVQRAGSRGLCGSIRAWYRAAFPSDRAAGAGGEAAMAVRGRQQDAALRCSGREVTLGIGPDLQTARDLAGLSRPR